MMTIEQKEQFHQQGYLIIPNILTTKQVQGLREFFRPKFAVPPEARLPGDSERYVFLPFSRYPDVRWLFFHEPALSVLKALLGERFAATPDDSVHLNGFGRWHKDTTSPELDGHTFHYQDDYLIVTAAYYLQDNTSDYGGGLDIQPRSHLERSDCFVAQRKERMHKPQAGLLQKTLLKLTGRGAEATDFDLPNPSNVLSVPSRAGDLVLFDCRINHRATPARQTNLPVEKEKIAIFATYSRDNAYAPATANYSRGRKDYAYLRDFSWPADFRAQAAAAGINLV